VPGRGATRRRTSRAAPGALPQVICISQAGAPSLTTERGAPPNAAALGGRKGLRPVGRRAADAGAPQPRRSQISRLAHFPMIGGRRCGTGVGWAAGPLAGHARHACKRSTWPRGRPSSRRRPPAPWACLRQGLHRHPSSEGLRRAPHACARAPAHTRARAHARPRTPPRTGKNRPDLRRTFARISLYLYASQCSISPPSHRSRKWPTSSQQQDMGMIEEATRSPRADGGGPACCSGCRVRGRRAAAPPRCGARSIRSSVAGAAEGHRPPLHPSRAAAAAARARARAPKRPAPGGPPAPLLARHRPRPQAAWPP
jgi:hypothetical protein